MSKNKVGPGKVLFHCILVVLTGGLWALWLIVRALLKH